MTESVSIRLALCFALLSLNSIGGTPTILAELQRYTVNTAGWLTSPEFINIFALSQIAPGPGTLIATLIGWKVDGLMGAVVATLAYGGPSSFLYYSMAMFLRRRERSVWKGRIEQGLVPVAIGLTIAGSSSVVISSEHSAVMLPAAVISAAVLTWRSISPLLIILTAALVFALIFRWA